jgi:methyl-accepting chemotaxis protein
MGMKGLLEKLKSFYIEPELQFRFAATLLVLITVEGAFIGMGMTKLISLAKDWQRESLVWDFFWTLSWLLVPLVVFNIFIGFYWSVRLARPLKDLENGLKNLREGRLSALIESHPEDAMNELIQSFNETATKIQKIIDRDQRLISEILKDLRTGESARPKALKKILLSARSKLSVVNSHFNSRTRS